MYGTIVVCLKKQLISALFCLRSCNYDKTCVKPDYTTAHFLPPRGVRSKHLRPDMTTYPPNRAQSQPNDRGVQKARISVCPPGSGTPKALPTKPTYLLYMEGGVG